MNKKNNKLNEKIYFESSSLGIWLIIITIVLLIFPIMWVIYASFASFNNFESLNQKLVEFGSFSIDNYKSFLIKNEFSMHLWNSILTSSLAVLINVLVASTGAFIFKFYKVRLNKMFVFIILTGVIIQFHLIAPNISGVMSYFGLNNTVFGVALLYGSLSLPFSFYVFSKYFEKTPKEITELAIMDGMSSFLQYYRIEMPYARPAIVISSAFCLFYSWNDLIVAEFILKQDEQFTLNQAIRLIVSGGIGLGELFSLCSITAIFAFFIYYIIGRNTVFNEINRV